MTVNGLIGRVDSLKPNAYSREDKLGWLSQLDGFIYHELILTHEGGETAEFTPYGEDSGGEELLAPSPWGDEIYNWYLQAQIDLNNAETRKYNQSVMLFNEAYRRFADWYNRTHMPKGGGQFRW